MQRQIDKSTKPLVDQIQRQIDELTKPSVDQMRRQIDELTKPFEDQMQRYSEALRRVVDLAPVLDRFFDEVLVMDKDEDTRRARIALLQKIGSDISRTARLTEMVVDKAGTRAKASG
jgi:glycyl-tRNA synthetase beta subunit